MNDLIQAEKAKPFQMPEFIPNGARVHADGIYFNLPEDHYHSDPALGSNGVRDLLQSPLTYWINSPYNADRPEEDDKTDALNLGDYVHDRLLHNEKRFAIKPDGMSFATKEGKAWREEQAGATIIPYKQHQAAEMIFRAMETAGVAEHFHGGEPEVSVFWTEPNGFRCKIRIDYLRPTDAFDIKTYANTMHKDVETVIAHAVATHRYHVSAYWYGLGIAAMRTLLDRRNHEAIIGPATSDQIALLGEISTIPAAKHFPLWFLFMETGGIPNLTIRRFVERDSSGEINAYARAARNEVDRATRLFAQYMQSHGPDRMWIDEATSKSFTDEEFTAARWILEEA